LYASNSIGNSSSLKYLKDGEWQHLFDDLNSCYGLAIDNFGNLLIAATASHTIQRVRNGKIEIIAGGMRGHKDGKLPEFDGPFGIAVDSSGIYISDRDNHTIRKIITLGLWNTENHKKFPSEMQKEILTLLILSKNNKCLYSKCPKDILYLIFQFLTLEATYL